MLDVVFDDVSADSPQAKEARAKAEPRSFASETAIAMRAISDDNVAIYPIYAGCLYSPFYSASSENPHAAGMKELVGGIHAREEAMDEIAKKTGGRAYYERNDLKNALREALDESKASYTLGFYPDSDQFNGKFRVVKVKVAGRSGIRLRYRQGYLDSPQVLGKPQETKPN
jgi:VWFA-related protein